MSIRPGRDWGGAGGLPPDAAVVATDADAAAVVAQAAGGAHPVVGLVGGDLCRTLGGRGDRAHLLAPDAPRLPVDVGWIRLDDGEERPFVAHVVARRRGWRGRVVAIMNAERVGDWKLAPRAHPGDGRLDVLDGQLGLDQRLAARSRVRTGDHVPHPAIAERRVRALEVDLGAAIPVRIDGVACGRARHLTVRVEPGGLTVVV
ncbi:MAG TPA: hypothetical protein VK866_16920 [Acidimicrobiales bacterium]|nr:hypothetical protein [Acidimicrobiales bacterium]